MREMRLDKKDESLIFMKEIILIKKGNPLKKVLSLGLKQQAYEND